jgi:DNA polymerase alpha-associated DNA helicase A
MSLGDSRSNEAEAALVRMHVSNLIEAGVKPDDIAVVTPYNAQVRISNSPAHLTNFVHETGDTLILWD